MKNTYILGRKYFIEDLSLSYTDDITQGAKP